MKKSIFCLLFSGIVLSLYGCATIYEQQQISSDPDPVVRRFVSLRHIQTGLTRAEVKALLGDQVIIGYDMPDSREERYMPIVMGNPYRVENVKFSGKTYDIDYYFVGINVSDDKIADDELTPMVFKDDKLAGWGWDFLKRIKG